MQRGPAGIPQRINLCPRRLRCAVCGVRCAVCGERIMVEGRKNLMHALNCELCDRLHRNIPAVAQATQAVLRRVHGTWQPAGSATARQVFGTLHTYQDHRHSLVARASPRYRVRPQCCFVDRSVPYLVCLLQISPCSNQRFNEQMLPMASRLRQRHGQRKINIDVVSGVRLYY